jgi:hypothetical protein
VLWIIACMDRMAPVVTCVLHLPTKRNHFSSSPSPPRADERRETGLVAIARRETSKAIAEQQATLLRMTLGDLWKKKKIGGARRGA